MQSVHHVAPQTFVYKEYMSVEPTTNVTDWVSMTFYFQEDSAIFHYTGILIADKKPFGVDGRVEPAAPTTTCSDRYSMVVVNPPTPNTTLIATFFPTTVGTMCALDWDTDLHNLVLHLEWTDRNGSIHTRSAAYHGVMH
jgi:hypothetical protein